MVQGVIAFEGFQVDNIVYNKLSSDQSENYSQVSPEFFIVKTENENDDQEFNIIMGVKIDDSEEEESSLPFTAEVIIRGFYTVNLEDASDNSIEDLHTFKLINGSAILYPYLRSVLTDISSKSSHNPIILPTINFTKFIESRDLDDLLVDSSNFQQLKK
jgi:preprotein translocase subunit SecB